MRLDSWHMTAAHLVDRGRPRPDVSNARIPSVGGPGALDGAAVHYERHRLEQTTLHHRVQRPAATFFAETDAAGPEPFGTTIKERCRAYD